MVGNLWRPVLSTNAVLVALILTLGSTALRGEEEKQNFTVGEYAFKKLDEAQKLLQEEKHSQARSTLDEMSRRKGLTAHETALMHQIYGYIEAAQGHHRKAIDRFEKALAQNALPAAAELDLRFNLAQLYMATEQFEKAVTFLKAWFAKAEKPSAQAYYLLAAAYAQLGKSDLAIAPAVEAVKRSPEPKEAWLQLLASLYLDTKQYAKSLDLLKQLAQHFSKKTYWIQLSAVYAELGKESEALAAMQVAHAAGYLDQDTELRNLARMYLYQQIPYRAAQVLEKGIADKIVKADVDAWQLLGDAWLSARELDRALEPLERAAKISNDGNLYLRIGQIHVDRERWQEAIDALQNAIERSNLKERGRAFLLLGIAQYSTGKSAAAERAFREAEKYDQSRRSAKQWLRHVSQEADG